MDNGRLELSTLGGPVVALILPMRIALISPLFESVPPRFYGGTERVVDGLCRGLTDAGHEVTLFASGDSTAPVTELVPVCPEALRLAVRAPEDPLAYNLRLMAW